MMSSLFDLVSDGLQYKQSAVKEYENICVRILSPLSCKLLVDLLQAKRNKQIPRDGLQRGEIALIVVLDHLLELETFGKSHSTREVGELFQVVDDLLDFDDDNKSDHLNFLKGKSAGNELKKLLDFKLSKLFTRSPKPFVLLKAISWAEAIAERRIKDLATHTQSITPEVQLPPKAMTN